MQISSKKLESDKDYAECGIVMRADRIGNYSFGGLHPQGVYRYISVYRGKGKSSKLLEFVGEAPYETDESGERVLDMSRLKIGDVVLKPGFVYRERPWTSTLFSLHLRAMKVYKPKTIVKAGAPDLPPINIGTIKASPSIH